MNTATGSGKGFAYVQFEDSEPAIRALDELDGTFYQGRILHVLPAAAKRDSKLDEFEISKMPLKKQRQIKRKSEAASSLFNWNALYMNVRTARGGFPPSLLVISLTLTHSLTPSCRRWRTGSV